MSGDRYMHLRRLLGDDLLNKVQKTKVLVVGAGGIGCELLKNLVTSGFLDIEVIDLDTIDVSNLNRQFLFRRHHVGMSKALVAKDMVTPFNPDAKVVAHHGNIFEQRFGLEYFRQFAIVLNALDNIKARNHVNRMCLAVDVPLVESGTKGYLGQVQPIIKGKTACYECEEKPRQKQFAVCTLRATPSTMVHCVHWGKILFGLLFGEKDDSNVLSDGNEQDQSVFGVGSTERVFEHYFSEKIDEALQKKEAWKLREEPYRHTLSNIFADATKPDYANEGEAEWAEALDDHVVCSTDVSARCFLGAHYRLAARAGSSGEGDFLTFDKDDADAMDFVTAAANLRAEQFHIKTQTRFQIKEIAGNIIPAISTTNAITAGIIVSEAYKLIQGKVDESRYVNIVRNPISGRSGSFLLNGCVNSKPRRECMVCNKAIIDVYIDTNRRTIGFLIDEVLKGQLSLVGDLIITGDKFSYEEGDDLDDEDLEFFQANRAKLISYEAFELVNKQFDVDSMLQKIDLKVNIIHRDEDPDDENSTPFEVKQGGQGLSGSFLNTSTTEEDLNQDQVDQSSNKRKREDSQDNSEHDSNKKKQALETITDDDVIVL